MFDAKKKQYRHSGAIFFMAEGIRDLSGSGEIVKRDRGSDIEARAAAQDWCCDGLLIASLIIGAGACYGGVINRWREPGGTIP